MSIPQPRTSIVLPPALRAPRCASASIPRAPPLTTQTPARPRAPPSRRETSAPPGEQLRAPTMPTRKGGSPSEAPIANRAAGGSKRSSRSFGYSGSPTATIRAPIPASRSRTRVGSTVAARRRSAVLPASPAWTRSRQTAADACRAASSSKRLGVSEARCNNTIKAPRSSDPPTNPGGQTRSTLVTPASMSSPSGPRAALERASSLARSDGRRSCVPDSPGPITPPPPPRSSAGALGS